MIEVYIVKVSLLGVHCIALQVGTHEKTHKKTHGFPAPGARAESELTASPKREQ